MAAPGSGAVIPFSCPGADRGGFAALSCLFQATVFKQRIQLKSDFFVLEEMRPAALPETTSLLSPGVFHGKTEKMRKLLIAFAATLVATVSVFAAELQGVVAEVDNENRTVTLDDGATMPVAEGVDISSIAPGDTVNIITDDASGEITEVMIAE